MLLWVIYTYYSSLTTNPDIETTPTITHNIWFKEVLWLYWPVMPAVIVFLHTSQHMILFVCLRIPALWWGKKGDKKVVKLHLKVIIRFVVLISCWSCWIFAPLRGMNGGWSGSASYASGSVCFLVTVLYDSNQC